MTAIVVWRRRESNDRPRQAHAFIDGVPLCPSARLPVGTPTQYQGRVLRPFGAVEELGPGGLPFGPTCTICAVRARRARAA